MEVDVQKRRFGFRMRVPEGEDITFMVNAASLETALALLCAQAEYIVTHLEDMIQRKGQAYTWIAGAEESEEKAAYRRLQEKLETIEDRIRNLVER